jgi:predicted MPP superfamily phosphohydrolase
MTVGLNVLYAWPLPYRVLRFTRKLDVLLIVAAPLLFTYALDILWTRALSWQGPLDRALSTYTVVCFFLGVVVAPISQLRYWLRRTAPQQTKVSSEVMDVAERLGFAPAGHGKQAPLCRLSFNQVFEVEFNEKTLVLPQIPAAWDGLTILHLSDLHFCGTPDRTFYRYVLEYSLKDGPPDLVALTGDVVDSKMHHRWVLPLLGRVRGKEGQYAILGNHDHYRDVTMIRRRLRRAGFRVLVNSWEPHTLRGEPLVIVGHEGPWQRGEPDLSGAPEGLFRLCLSHSPDSIAWARKNRIDLMLAGHVHGGQIRFPLIGSTFCPSRYSRRYDCGTFFEAPTVMHVSRGLAGQHPLRVLCRPEVTRVVLRKQ